MVDVTAVVLAGGESRRFGSDKLGAAYAVSTVLDTLLAALPPGWDVVVVGPERPVTRAVTWTREEPAGGGPLAAVAAGLRCTTTDLVVVIAGDMPEAAPAATTLAAQLAGADTDVGAVVALDGTTRPNPLLAAYRRGALEEALPPDPAGRAARSVLDRLTWRPHTVAAPHSLDVDTPEDLASLRAHRRS